LRTWIDATFKDFNAEARDTMITIGGSLARQQLPEKPVTLSEVALMKIFCRLVFRERVQANGAGEIPTHRTGDYCVANRNRGRHLIATAEFPTFETSFGVRERPPETLSRRRATLARRSRPDADDFGPCEIGPYSLEPVTKPNRRSFGAF
jgi:hypothetical protein